MSGALREYREYVRNTGNYLRFQHSYKAFALWPVILGTFGTFLEGKRADRKGVEVGKVESLRQVKSAVWLNLELIPVTTWK